MGGGVGVSVGVSVGVGVGELVCGRVGVRVCLHRRRMGRRREEGLRPLQNPTILTSTSCLLATELLTTAAEEKWPRACSMAVWPLNSLIPLEEEENRAISSVVFAS